MPSTLGSTPALEGTAGPAARSREYVEYVVWALGSGTAKRSSIVGLDSSGGTSSGALFCLVWALR